LGGAVRVRAARQAARRTRWDAWIADGNYHQTLDVLTPAGRSAFDELAADRVVDDG